MTETTKKKDVTSFKASFNALMTLTKMQLQEKMDVSYLRSFKATLFKTVFMLLEFVVVTVVCYFLLYFASLLKVFSATGDIPNGVMLMVTLFMLGLSIVFTTVGLVKSLYLSRDNLVLLTFPTTPTMVFLSKLLVYYVYEFKKNFMFLIPFFFAFGFMMQVPVYYYPWIFVLFVFVAMLPVLIAALLSMPALYLVQSLRKRKILQYALIGLGLVGALALVMWLIGLIPSNIDLQKEWRFISVKIYNFISDFSKSFPVLMAFIQLLIGRREGIKVALFHEGTVLALVVFLVLLAVLATLCLVLAQPLFYKMASKPFEYAKKTKIEANENKQTKVGLACLKKEWRVALRNNEVSSLVSQLVVIMPLAVELLNKLYAVMNTRFLGLQMTVCFNFLIISLFMLSANIRLSSAYSKDGHSAYLNKVQPSTYGRLLFAKLTPNLVFGAIGLLITTYIYSRYGALDRGLNYVLFFVSAYALYVIHAFWSAEMDIMNPQYEQYATFSEQANNPNENKSSLLTFGLSALCSVALLLLSMESENIAWIKMSVVLVALALFRIFAYFIKIKVYYKEKQ